MKVLLSGYYGYGNLGDELMRMGMEDFLKRYKIDYTIALPKRVSKDSVSRFNLLEIIGAIFDADALIYGGGGLLQDVTSTRSFLYYVTTIYISLLMGKPVILFGNSFGPVKKPLNRFLLRKVIKNGKVYPFPRDLVSYRYAKRLNKHTELSCDPSVRYLATIQPLPEKTFEAVLVPRKIENIGKYDCLKRHFEKVLVCPVQYSDVETAKKIAQRLDAEVIDNPNDIQNVLSIILSSKFVISERFHPTLIAAYFGIPFISLENSKAERFFKKYTDRREFFAKDMLEFPQRYEKIVSAPLYLKTQMDKECEESFKKLYKILIRIKTLNIP